jgi:hypothetical protein
MLQCKMPFTGRRNRVATGETGWPIVRYWTLLFMLGSIEAAAACEQSAWPLSLERNLLRQAVGVTLYAPVSLENVPEHGFILRLQHSSVAEFALPPRQPTTADGFAGRGQFEAPIRPGTVQVTLSDEAWVDVVQEGRYVEPLAMIAPADCPGVARSIRFVLGAKPFVLQVSRSLRNAVGMVITRPRAHRSEA